MNTNTWEEEFRKKFVASITSSPGNIEHARSVIFFEDVVKIEAFIKKLLEDELAKVIEKVNLIQGLSIESKNAVINLLQDKKESKD